MRCCHKTVEETYINETDELIHVHVNGETISATPNHPFYVDKLGWTLAKNLRAGDILVLSNGEFVVVEWIQHEILENPVKVYNFKVEDFHTYFVGESSVLVYNQCPSIESDIDSDGVSNPKLYRKMSEAEAELTLKNGLQPAKKGADPTKWTSESLSKVREFDNAIVKPGTNEVIIEFELNPEYYNYVKNTAVPQYGSKGNPNIKFHYEGLDINGIYRNYGITPDQLAYFNQNVINIRIVE